MNGIVLSFFIAVVLGLLLRAWALFDAYVARRNVRKEGRNGGVLLIADNAIWFQRIHVLVKGLWALTGVVVIFGFEHWYVFLIAGIVVLDFLAIFERVADRRVLDKVYSDQDAVTAIQKVKDDIQDVKDIAQEAKDVAQAEKDKLQAEEE